ncbi:hypothetical protein GCM10027091_74080 [Streptomyces daliensis]
MLQQGRQLVPHRLDRGAHPGLVCPHPHRQHVDERAEHSVGARAGVHPAEEDGAEHHVVPARQGGKHPRPRHVQDGRGADTQLARHPPQLVGETLGQRHARLDDPAAVAAHVQQAVGGGRLGHVAQEVVKETSVLLARHRPRLRDEVAERQRRCQVLGLAGQHRPQLVQQHIHADVVLHHVMHPHDGQPTALGCLRRVQIHQRGTAQVHRRARQGDKGLHPARPLCGVAVDLVLDDGQCHVPPHHLHGLAQPFPHHARAVDVVPIRHLLQRSREHVQPGA